MDVNGNHNRSSSVTAGSDMNRNSGREPTNGYSDWGQHSGYDEATWDPFSDGEDDTPWPAHRSAIGGRGHRRGQASTASGRTDRSDGFDGGANIMGGTLRPYRQTGSRSQLRPPKEPNKAALMGTNRRLMEEELSMLYEEMGAQAEMMMALLAGLVIEEESLEMASGL